MPGPERVKKTRPNFDAGCLTWRERFPSASVEKKDILKDSRKYRVVRDLWPMVVCIEWYLRDWDIQVKMKSKGRV